MRDPKNRFVRSCCVAVILLLALFLSFQLLPTAHAKETCLRIAMPKVYLDHRGADAYRHAMAQAGLCVEPIALPATRSIEGIRTGTVDGILVARDNLPDLCGVSVVRGDVTFANMKGLLVVRDGAISGVDDLKDQLLGVALGQTWSTDLMGTYANLIKVPGGPEMMHKMLFAGRLDAILIDAYSLRVLGGALDAYKIIPVADLALYSWLRGEFAHYLPQFDQGTVNYRKVLADL
ncbi:hypothetical protein [Thalassospira lucentensis]|uniref:hypothetical protein n=1 Tax=Thalassospira lucentensis TaxID=168935 RepID=UPI00142E1038|nr:hypothetical protein [Thalassospira lucentensis]NIZ01356.1 hypothetical protein [Thalassospira lucentensis]